MNMDGAGAAFSLEAGVELAEVGVALPPPHALTASTEITTTTMRVRCGTRRIKC
jgi:hypothetical protein